MFLRRAVADFASGDQVQLAIKEILFECKAFYLLSLLISSPILSASARSSLFRAYVEHLSAYRCLIGKSLFQ